MCFVIVIIIQPTSLSMPHHLWIHFCSRFYNRSASFSSSFFFLSFGERKIFAKDKKLQEKKKTNQRKYHERKKNCINKGLFFFLHFHRSTKNVYTFIHGILCWIMKSIQMQAIFTWIHIDGDNDDDDDDNVDKNVCKRCVWMWICVLPCVQ